MKKLFVVMLSSALVLGMSTAVNANVTTVAQERVQDAKKAITLDELPEAVKATLASDGFKDFKAESATIIQSGTQVMYEVTGKRADKTEVLHFGADGKQVAK